MLTDKKPVVLGRVSGLFGVRGWLKIHSYTKPRDAILNYQVWLIELDGAWRSVDLAEGRRQGKSIVARFRDICDRDAAAVFLNSTIGVERNLMPETGKDEYYWTDLEGLRVEKHAGDYLGTVAYLLETGSNDVMVVKGEGNEVLIPFIIGDVIKDVNLDEGKIVVEWEVD
ncbi:MAG: ribosome maturation factor RimM [Woeseia sp.]|nr:ribosome maturation factor RimM [Woeseia sp.]|tara:strand:+ start:84 stop:593 length:510 start_codon:yes stop_codon:yes gene_type:complete